MWWDDPNDSPDKQRFKNLMLFKFYGTNEERDEALPWIMGLLLLIVLGAALYSCVRA